MGRCDGSMWVGRSYDERDKPASRFASGHDAPGARTTMGHGVSPPDVTRNPTSGNLYVARCEWAYLTTIFIPSVRGMFIALLLSTGLPSMLIVFVAPLIATTNLAESWSLGLDTRQMAMKSLRVT